MAHLTRTKYIYKMLIKKVDSYPIGYPENDIAYRLISMLYTPEEAEIVSRMPLKPTTLRRLSEIVAIGEEELREKLRIMAEKGIVIDMEQNHKVYYMPMWSVPGFIEMTLAKLREDIPQKELSKVLSEAMKDKELISKIFNGDTQFGRALMDDRVAEERADVLPYEVAKDVIKEAKRVAFLLCYCRHKEKHIGGECQYPMEVCTALNIAADYVIKHNIGKEVDKGEAIDVIEQLSEKGLMHIGDNVKRNITFICHCCKCCCGILRSYHDHGFYPVAMSTRFKMVVDEAKCVGCGRCARRCQINAITMKPTLKPGELKAHIDERICLGCGICYRACNKGALHLEERKEKVILPEHGMEKLIRIAIERGKLQDMLFDNVYSTRDRVLRRIFGVIFKRHWVKNLLLSDRILKRIVMSTMDRAEKRGLPEVI